jgi:hypothetical protein
LRGLVELIRVAQLRRFLKPQVEKLLEDGIAAGQLDPAKFDPKLRDYFRQKVKAMPPGAPSA